MSGNEFTEKIKICIISTEERVPFSDQKREERTDKNRSADKSCFILI